MAETAKRLTPCRHGRSASQRKAAARPPVVASLVTWMWSAVSMRADVCVMPAGAAVGARRRRISRLLAVVHTVACSAHAASLLRAASCPVVPCTFGGD